jgi:hypothetical protein
VQKHYIVDIYSTRFLLVIYIYTHIGIKMASYTIVYNYVKYSYKFAVCMRLRVT